MRPRIRRGILIALAALICIPLFIFLGGELVMRLWNWLLPSLFGWRAITFWQAVGILALCRILFGSFGGRRHHRPNFRRRMAERWEPMSPEEREKFRQGMRGRCGRGGIPAAETNPQAPA
jgi:hypothetical protein